MPKAFVFTDIHASRSALDELEKKVHKHKPDLLLCSGDHSIFENGLDFTLRKLDSFGIPCLTIHGNHEDEVLTQGICKKLKHVKFIHASKHEQDGILFLGFGGGGFHAKDQEFDDWVQTQKKEIDAAASIVLLVHQPVHGTKTDQLYSGSHVGSKSYRKFIEKHSKKVKLVLCGHIHDSFGEEDTVAGVRIMNPGPQGKIVNL